MWGVLFKKLATSIVVQKWVVLFEELATSITVQKWEVLHKEITSKNLYKLNRCTKVGSSLYFKVVNITR